MHHYEPKTFTIPALTGISAKNIEEHLKLYQGYVKHVNLVSDQLQALTDPSLPADPTGARTYHISELNRRFSFEYNGMKNHEYYFEQLESGPSPLDIASVFGQKILAQFGSFEAFISHMTNLALTRGIGWAVLWYDRDADQLLTNWIDEQHLGHLNSAQFIFGIDVWEHAYVADYQPSGKKQYVTDYLSQVNWKVVAARIA